MRIERSIISGDGSGGSGYGLRPPATISRAWSGRWSMIEVVFMHFSKTD